MDAEQRTSRSRFLKQLGVGLAVGVGAAVLPSRAHARGDGLFECCASTQHCSQNCSGTDKDYWCDCGGSTYCTGCRTYQGACYTATC
jgi:hypothetical protein